MNTELLFLMRLWYLTRMKIKALLFLPLLYALTVTANTPPSDHADGPCIKVMDACKAAGYGAKDAPPAKKSLSKNCIQPLMDGARPADVVANEADIAACKAKKSQLKKSN